MKPKARIMSTRNAVRANSMLPKNAINFYKLKKGLYLKKSSKARMRTLSREDSQFIGSEGRAIAKSVGILTAYGEMAQGQ